MTKQYLFLANGAINRESFKDALDSLGAPYEIAYEGPDKGFIAAEPRFAVLLQSVMAPLHEDLNIALTVVSAHRAGELELKAVREALAYFPNRCLFLTDVLMKEFSFGDYSSLPLLRKEFIGVGHELSLTAEAYLRCGLNASLAAESLIIHRNTFDYRLGKFIDLTGLDIRDYHNALLLEIYFQFAAR